MMLEKYVLMADIPKISLDKLPRDVLFNIFDYLTVGDLQQLRPHLEEDVMAYCAHMTRNLFTRLSPSAIGEKLRLAGTDWQLSRSFSENIVEELLCSDVIIIRPSRLEDIDEEIYCPTARAIVRKSLELSAGSWKHVYVTCVADIYDGYGGVYDGYGGDSYMAYDYAVYLELTKGSFRYWDFTIIRNSTGDMGTIMREENRDYSDFLCGGVLLQ
jgi:hypothetical protein